MQSCGVGFGTFQLMVGLGFLQQTLRAVVSFEDQELIDGARVAQLQILKRLHVLAAMVE